MWTSLTWDEKREAMREILSSTWFDVAIGVVIMLNAVSISVEQSLYIEGKDTNVLRIFESMFLVIYVFELGLRLFGHGIACFRDGWVRLDALLVTLGILNSWFIEPFLSEEESEAMGPVMLLRTARLLRLAKTARLFARIQEFWMLVRGLLTSATIMTYTFVILFLVLYIFSSLGIEVITKHQLNMGPEPDPEFQEHVEKYFRTLPSAMLTLLQFACLDEVATVYRPLVSKDPWLAFYFAAVILVVGIIIMNLVSAVVITSTLDQNTSEQDAMKALQEEKWRNLIADLKDMFVRLDADKSGNLTRDEIVQMPAADHATLCDALGVETAAEVFKSLDVDHKGVISINEFFDHILDRILAKGSVDLKRMERQIETMHWRLKETFSAQHEVHLALKTAINKLGSIEAEQQRLQSIDRAGSAKDAAPKARKAETNCNGSQAGAGKSVKAITSPRVASEMPAWAEELVERLMEISKDMASSLARSTHQYPQVQEKADTKCASRPLRMNGTPDVAVAKALPQGPVRAKSAGKNLASPRVSLRRGPSPIELAVVQPPGSRTTVTYGSTARETTDNVEAARSRQSTPEDSQPL